MSSFRYRLDNLVRQVIWYHDLDLDLRQEAHVIFRAAIDFGLSLLSAEALDFRHGQSLNPQRGQGLPDVVKLEGLDDGHDEFHVGRSSGLSLGLREACIVPVLLCRSAAAIMNNGQTWDP